MDIRRVMLKYFRDRFIRLVKEEEICFDIGYRKRFRVIFLVRFDRVLGYVFRNLFKYVYYLFNGLMNIYY